MFNFFVSVTLIGLLIPNGLNFLTDQAIDFPYSEIINQTQQAPSRVVNNSFGLETSADSLAVIDDVSQTVLYSKNSGAVKSIASVTKLMTALVFLDTQPDWESTVVIVADDLRQGGIARFSPGEEVTVKDLFNVMLVASANEAAVALARTSGIDNFSEAMNQKAKALEMWQSYFVEPSGVDARNVSRPADLIKLAGAAFSNSAITAALSQAEYSFTTINTARVGAVVSTNELLDSFLNNNQDYQVLGAKTGYIDEAGYCLLMQVRKINGPVLTLVILGADSPIDRWQEAKGLIDWVVGNYQWP